MVRVDLSNYGYVNARVRGMRSHLLTKDFFMHLVEAENFEALNSLLEQTIYRREVNEALLLDPERPDYDQALNVNLVASLRKIVDSTGGEPRRLVSLLFTDYDVQNIKTIIRGKKGNATASEIIAAMIPVGNLRIDSLEILAKEREIKGVLEQMEMMQIRYARPLINKFNEYLEKDHDLAILELALDKFHYVDVMSELKKKDRNVEMVHRMFRSQIDMRNISTLARIRGIRLEDDEVKDLWIPDGTLTQVKFLELDRLGDIVRIVSEYPDPGYKKLLERALAEYQELDVVAFDRELERELTKLGAGMSNIDVLGIGVIIGYMWSKRNEIINLRIVLKGKLMEKAKAEIRKDLFFVEREAGEAA